MDTSNLSQLLTRPTAPLTCTLLEPLPWQLVLELRILPQLQRTVQAEAISLKQASNNPIGSASVASLFDAKASFAEIDGDEWFYWRAMQ